MGKYKGIIITNENKVVEQLKDVQKSSETRTISYADIVCSLKAFEEQLNITKKAMEGVEVTVNIHNAKFAQSYKYIPSGTIFKAIFKGNKWRLWCIYRGACNGGDKMFTVKLTEDAKACIIKNYENF